MSSPVTAIAGVTGLPRRLRDSAAYRSAFVYRSLLRLLPRPATASRLEIDLTFLTFGGAGHRLMLEQCLFSLHRAWPALPRVRIVSDGSLDLEQARSALSWWPGPWELLGWRDLVPGLLDRGHGSLVRFAERDAMGRKMAAIVAGAAGGAVLYCDVDVLWFRFPPTLDRLLAAAGPSLAMSSDPYPAYDPALVPGRLPELAAPPHFCAGVLFARGDFLAACRVEPLLADAAERGIGLSEQTILAEADRQLGGDRWPEGEIFLGERDRFSLAPSYRHRPWAARHYVGQVRHLFWRDALALRAGIRPGPPQLPSPPAERA
jgi:hypothetical protein